MGDYRLRFCIPWLLSLCHVNHLFTSWKRLSHPLGRGEDLFAGSKINRRSDHSHIDKKIFPFLLDQLCIGSAASVRTVLLEVLFKEQFVVLFVPRNNIMLDMNRLILFMGWILACAGAQEAIREDNSTTVVQGVTTVECGLDSTVIQYGYNSEQGVFVQVVEDTSALNGSDYQNLPGVELRNIEYARSCWCSQFYDIPVEYCPADFASCSVKGSTGDIKCYNLSQSASLMRGMWPIALCWYFILAVAWFCSRRGTQAKGHAYRLCCLGCSEQAKEAAVRQEIDEIVENRSYRIVVLRESAMRRRKNIVQMGIKYPELKWLSKWMLRNEEPDMDEVLAYQPVQQMNTTLLSMKVKAFQSENATDRDHESADAVELGDIPQQSNKDPLAEPEALIVDSPSKTAITEADDVADDSDDEKDACAICLKALHTGEMIGDIPCGHLFHKDCLKDWLVRKNACPLCQRKEIAQLKRKTSSTVSSSPSPAEGAQTNHTSPYARRSSSGDGSPSEAVIQV